MDIDAILQRLDLHQKENESDWDFRKRAFPALWKYFTKGDHTTVAMEFLFFLDSDGWSGLDEARYMRLFFSSPDINDLEKFIEGFSCDPVEFRNPEVQ